MENAVDEGIKQGTATKQLDEIMASPTLAQAVEQALAQCSSRQATADLLMKIEHDYEETARAETTAESMVAQLQEEGIAHLSGNRLQPADAVGVCIGRLRVLLQLKIELRAKLDDFEQLAAT